MKKLVCLSMRSMKMVYSAEIAKILLRPQRYNCRLFTSIESKSRIRLTRCKSLKYVSNEMFGTYRSIERVYLSPSCFGMSGVETRVIVQRLLLQY